MSEYLRELARTLANSTAHDLAVDWLRTVPGLPPIVQTLHLLSVAIVLGSIVVLSLRVLGWAAPSQAPEEMSRRLAPWTWTALPVLVASGFVFVVARPQRYFSNPMFGLKVALLVPALALTALLYGLVRRPAANRTVTRVVALASLAAWVCIILAGRWIAYVDYLFPHE